MSAKDIYCQVSAWKRLREKGAKPSEALEIADEIYKRVKQSCHNSGKKDTDTT